MTTVDDDDGGDNDDDCDDDSSGCSGDDDNNDDDDDDDFSAPSITEEEAREAILQHVAEHCCFGKTAAKEMTFRELKSSSAFHVSAHPQHLSSCACGCVFVPFSSCAYGCVRVPSFLLCL